MSTVLKIGQEGRIRVPAVARSPRGSSPHDVATRAPAPANVPGRAATLGANRTPFIAR